MRWMRTPTRRPIMKRTILSLVFILAWTGTLEAQIATGTPPFSSIGGGPVDAVNLGNLNVHLSVPILHKAGRGYPLNYDLSYDSSIYQIVSGGWQPALHFGWTAQTQAATGYLTYTLVPNSGSCTDSSTNHFFYDYYFNFKYTDALNVVHPYNGYLYIFSRSDPPGLTPDCPSGPPPLTLPNSRVTGPVFL